MLIKSSEQIEKMRIACRLAAMTLEMIGSHIKAGIRTKELDSICHQYITTTLKAIPSTLNHHGFPASICASINHVVCHGIPGDKKLKSGDILNIDVTVKKDGFIGDTSKMFLIGEVKPFAKRLVNVSQQCMYEGIKAARPGNCIGDIGYAISACAQKHNYTVVHEFGGHGIGQTMWEDPHIPGFGTPGSGLALQPGMIFTIEPMVNQGKRYIKELGDGWTVITKDRKLSAQWEHTVLVTEDGVEILTLRDNEDFNI